MTRSVSMQRSSGKIFCRVTLALLLLGFSADADARDTDVSKSKIGQQTIPFAHGQSRTLPPDTDLDSLIDQSQIDSIRFAERRDRLLRGLNSLRIVVMEIRFSPESAAKVEHIEHTRLQDEAEKALKAAGITRIPFKRNPSDYPLNIPNDQTSLVIMLSNDGNKKNSIVARATLDEPSSLIRAPQLKTMATTWRMDKHANASTIDAARSKAVDAIIIELLRQRRESNSAGTKGIK